jgi:type I restriction enzyme S subunit
VNDYVRLGDIADLEIGFAFKSEGFAKESSGIRLLRGDNIAPGRTRWDRTEAWPQSDAVNERYFLRDGDVVLAMDRPWIEGGLKFARIRQSDLPSYLVQRVARLRAKDGTDQGYLACVIASKEFMQHVLTVQTGTSIPHISGRQITDYRLPRHTFEQQKSISDVLGTVNDKIDANTKLAATASELATAEFRLRIRRLPFSDQTFADVSKVSGGGTPSTSVAEFWDGGVPWATPTDVTALQGPYLSSTSRQISEAGLAACASDLYPTGSILMTSRATIGAFAIAQAPMAVNQGFIVVQPNDPELRFWFFHEMKSRVDEFISLANGATFLELSRGNFKKFKVRLAEPRIMKEFVALAAPLHAAAANALSENTELAATRDALLPQLMSGRLRVKDAQTLVSAAV